MVKRNHSIAVLILIVTLVLWAIGGIASADAEYTENLDTGNDKPYFTFGDCQRKFGI